MSKIVPLGSIGKLELIVLFFTSILCSSTSQLFSAYKISNENSVGSSKKNLISIEELTPIAEFVIILPLS
tara:strand:+ start:1006 stop:1215 length:210 start_codon:yes stop_codon:yes gene_type:complete